MSECKSLLKRFMGFPFLCVSCSFPENKYLMNCDFRWLPLDSFRVCLLVMFVFVCCITVCFVWAVLCHSGSSLLFDQTYIWQLVLSNLIISPTHSSLVQDNPFSFQVSKFVKPCKDKTGSIFGSLFSIFRERREDTVNNTHCPPVGPKGYQGYDQYRVHLKWICLSVII